MAGAINLSNVSVVLHRPRNPENIGAAARAVCNMGIDSLRIVAPEDEDRGRIERMATHAAKAIVENMSVYDSLSEALSGDQYIVGTTARLGGQRQNILSPSKMAEKLIPISARNRIALLFGPEDRGLTNEDIRFCHTLVSIPTASFSSLNLAQAVMVVCYELHKASPNKPVQPGPRLATRKELEQMYSQLKEILVRISYINPENPDYWISGMRRFFNRLPLRAKEVSIIRGICRQIDWYGRKSFEEGQASNRKSTAE